MQRTIFCLLTLALVACGSDDPASSRDGAESDLTDADDAGKTIYEECPAAADLQGRLWRLRFLETIEGGEPVGDAVPEDVEITMRFTAAGQVSGSAGCNQFFATYEVTDTGQLQIGDVAITEMFCQVPELMAWEDRFTAALGPFSAYGIEGDRLILEHAKGRLLLSESGEEPLDPGGELPDPDDVPQWHEATVSSGDVTVDYTVHACAADTGPTRSLAPTALFADGDALYFHQVVSTYCNALTDRALHIEPAIDGDTITLDLVFRGPAARCLCEFPVRGVIKGLMPGDYAVAIVYGVELEGGDHTEVEVLHEAEIVVGGTVVDPEPDPLPPEKEEVLRLAATDDGDTIELSSPGVRIEVALEANPSTGFVWLPAIDDGTVLRFVGDSFDEGDVNLVGAATTQRLQFDVVAPGDAVLRLVYARPWESVLSADTFEVGLVVLGGIVPREPDN